VAVSGAAVPESGVPGAGSRWRGSRGWRFLKRRGSLGSRHPRRSRHAVRRLPIYPVMPPMAAETRLHPADSSSHRRRRPLWWRSQRHPLAARPDVAALEAVPPEAGPEGAPPEGCPLSRRCRRRRPLTWRHLNRRSQRRRFQRGRSRRRPHPRRRPRRRRGPDVRAPKVAGPGRPGPGAAGPGEVWSDMAVDEEAVESPLSCGPRPLSPAAPLRRRRPRPSLPVRPMGGVVSSTPAPPGLHRGRPSRDPAGTDPLTRGSPSPMLGCAW
jgi:hypothetical protein